MSDSIIINTTTENINLSVSTTTDVYSLSVINVDGASRWSLIVGTLSAQTDLWNALSAKALTVDLLSLSSDVIAVEALLNALSGGGIDTLTTVSTNSANWNSSYSWVSTNSANAVFQTVSAVSLSGIFYGDGSNLIGASLPGQAGINTAVQSNSANWNSAYDVATTYQNVSSSYATSTLLQSTSALLTPLVTTNALTSLLVKTTDLNTLSAKLLLKSTFESLSGNWQDTFTNVQANSANWDYAYNTVIGGLSSNLWNEAYDIATNYQNISSSFATINFTDSKYLPLSGGEITNDLYVNGNVGIGTTTPSEKLQVEGNIQVNTATGDGYIRFNTLPGATSSQFYFANNGNDIWHFGPYWPVRNNFDFWSALTTSTAFTINAEYANAQSPNGFIVGEQLGGYVNSGNHRMQINATGTQTPLMIQGGSGAIEIWTDEFPTQAISFGTAVPGNEKTNDFIFASYPSGWVENMRIKSDTGNVGIGTTAPTTKLDVNGVITATGGTSEQWNEAYTNVITNSASYLDTPVYGTVEQIVATPGANNSVTLSLPNSITTPGDLNVTGSLFVNGTAANINTINLSLSDSLIYLGEGNVSNVIDIGFVGNYTPAPSAYQHTGLVRVARDNKWTLFSGVTAEPTTVVDFSGIYVIDTLRANIEGTLFGNVSGNISGNAGSVTNGVYTNGSYSDPSWITSLADTKITGTSRNNWDSAYSVATTYQNTSGTFATNTALNAASSVLLPTTVFRGASGNWQNTYTSWSTASSTSVVAFNDTRFAKLSSQVYIPVSSGSITTVIGSNSVNGFRSNINGGFGNTVNGSGSSIVGGCLNAVTGAFSSIVGGLSGKACQSYSSIVNGTMNTGSGCYSSVINGRNHTASGNYSVVVNGSSPVPATTGSSYYMGYIASGMLYTDNTCSSYTAYYPSITGEGPLYCCTGSHYTVIETGSRAYGQNSFIGNGASSCGTIEAYGCLVNTGTSSAYYQSSYTSGTWGALNIVTGCNSSILNGAGNCVTGNFSTVAGGCYNTVSGSGSNVAGGFFNTASGNTASTVGGGAYNTASGYTGSTVSGGYCNCATNNLATIGGGQFNTASGFSSTIAGGCYNTASGGYSGILGGSNNTVTHNNSFAIGSNITSDADNTTYVNNISSLGNIYGTFYGDGSNLTGITTNSYIYQQNDFNSDIGKNYLVDTSTNVINVTLPAGPQVGDLIVFEDFAGTWVTNPLILLNNGNLIESYNTPLTADLNSFKFKLIYTGITYGWRLY